MRSNVLLPIIAFVLALECSSTVKLNVPKLSLDTIDNFDNSLGVFLSCISSLGHTAGEDFVYFDRILAATRGRSETGS